jgi:hypothetical protein
MTEFESGAAFLCIQCINSFEDRSAFFTGIEASNLDVFFDLCERDYWARLWVVQEIVLAKQLEVYCEHNVATWTAFSRTLQQCQRYDRIKNSLPYLFDRQRSDRYYECRLLNLLEACQASKCSDPRDKVYWLLGLANDCSEDKLAVGYSNPLHDVYRDVIMFQSSGAHTKQYLLSPTKDLHVVRFSQMLQRSLQSLPGNNNISPDAAIARLEPKTHNHMATIIHYGNRWSMPAGLLKSNIVY